MPGGGQEGVDYEREAYALKHSKERRLLSDEPLVGFPERHRDLNAERWRQMFIALAKECKDRV